MSKQINYDGDHFKGADLALQPFPLAIYYVWKIGHMSQIRDIGKSLLIEMFYKTILSKFSGIDAAKAEEPIEKYGEDCLMAICNLKLIDDLGHSDVVIYKNFRKP